MSKRVILIILGCFLILAGIIYLSLKSDTHNNIPDWSRGADEPKVTILEYGDFQCPACGSYKTVMDRLFSDFGDNANFVFRHFPLMQIHKNAMSASLAAEAAGAQGKFWEMHDTLYEHQSEWSESANPKDLYIKYASAISLDIEKFKTDMDSDPIEAHVLANMKQGEKDDVSGTPTFFLNGKKIQNPGSYEDFATLITQAIGENPINSATSTVTTEPVHEHADFLVSINGSHYDFSQAKYQSSDAKARDPFVHLHDGNGHVIHTHKAGITLQYFFKSLGMNLSKTCFKLDTGVEYCNNDNSTLKLYVNGQPNDKFGSYILKDEDKILLSYGPKDDTTIMEQLLSITDDACMYSQTCPGRGKPPTEHCAGGLGTTCE